MRSTGLNQATGSVNINSSLATINQTMTKDEGSIDGEPQYVQPPLIPQVYPWLLISHGKQLQRHTFFSCIENRYHTRIVPYLRDKLVLRCCFGWLILEDEETDDCHLFNPVSMENIQLPLLESFDRVTSALLSGPPDDSNCHILFIGSPNRLAFCRLGDDNFVEQSSVFGEDSLLTVTVMNGKMYGLMLQSHALVTLDFVGPTILLRHIIKDGSPFQLPCPLPPENSFYDKYLIESSGEILFVFKIYSAPGNYTVAYFKVFRVNTSEIVCEEVKNLGDQVVFLNHHYGMTCSIQEPGIRRNSIYFAELFDRNLYVYNMENRSQSVKLPCPIAKRKARLSWVMPLLPSSS